MSRPTRWFEDVTTGDIAEFGEHLMTEADVIAFATAYDPQPFHIDAEAAQDSIFGGLIASGWHTGSVVMRMMVDHYLTPESSLGSPGVDEIRWIVPVRPGDHLRVRITVLSTVPSRSKPDRGIVHSLTEVLNQKDQVGMIRRRPMAA